jgi:hypothetical protein
MRVFVAAYWCCLKSLALNTDASQILHSNQVLCFGFELLFAMLSLFTQHND